MKPLLITPVAALTTASCAAAGHMQGTRGLTVVLQFVEQESGVPLEHARVEYRVAKEDAQDAGLPPRFAPFAKAQRFRFRTENEGKIQLMLAFHFSSYFSDEEPHFVEFLNCLGFFRIDHKGQWIERSLSKDRSPPVFIRWAETLHDPMNPEVPFVGDFSEEEEELAP